ncbi:MAG: nucleotide exchange factor GrpE [Treponema sp.]|nr:nucleotide exchange factor GrpE [Treponema sp.]
MSMEEEQNQSVEQEENETVAADSADSTEAAENQEADAAAGDVADGEDAAEEPKDELTALKAQVEELTKQNEDLKDQVLRRAADFENYRKRMLKEKQDAFDYANTNLLKDLLDSLDNFDRTVEAAATATDPKTIADGVKMINSGLVSMLENKYNLVSYGAVGDAFDPDIHEAIGSSNDPVAEPVLKAVYLKGYKLKDMVIRHAKVMVSMPDGTVQAEEKKD